MKFTLDTNNNVIEIEQLTFEEVFVLHRLIKELCPDTWQDYTIRSRFPYTTSGYAATTGLGYYTPTVTTTAGPTNATYKYSTSTSAI